MFPELSEFFISIFDFMNQYGFIIVFVFAVMHPMFELPASVLNLTLSISILGIGFGFVFVIFGNVIGLLLLYVLSNTVHQKTNNYLYKKRVSSKILLWIKNTSMIKHAIVIGAPLIPTYPIKIGVAFSDITFKKYIYTMGLAYTILYIGNSLIYFGIFGLITDVIPVHLAVFLLFLFALFVYFGNKLFKKEELKNALK